MNHHISQSPQRLLLFLCTLLLCQGAAATTYRLQRATKIVTSQMYVIEQAGFPAIGTIEGSYLKNYKSFSNTGLDPQSTNCNKYLWQISAGYTLKNVNIGNSGFLSGAGGKLAIGSGSSITAPLKWNISFHDNGIATITNASASDYQLCYQYTGTEDQHFRLISKSYAASSPSNIVIYQLVEEDAGKTSPALAFSQRYLRVVSGDDIEWPTLSRAAGHDGTITYTSTDERVASIDSETGEVTLHGLGGVTLITASTSATDSYDAGEATYTLVVMDGDGTVARPFSVRDFSTGYIPLDGTICVEGYVVGYKTVSFADVTTPADADYLVLADERTAPAGTATVLVGLSTDMQAAYGHLGHPQLAGKQVRITGKMELKSGRYTIHAASALTVEACPLTIGDTGYATLVADYAMDLSQSGITAYRAMVDEQGVLLLPITDGIIAQGAGVLVCHEAGATTLDVPVTTATPTVGDTGFSVSDGQTAIGSDIYVFSNKNQGLGFYRWAGASSLSQGRVYLRIPDAAARDYIGISFADDVTSLPHTIAVTSRDTDTAPCYNLQGQRVTHPAHGIYVVNGRKVVINRR